MLKCLNVILELSTVILQILKAMKFVNIKAEPNNTFLYDNKIERSINRREVVYMHENNIFESIKKHVMNFLWSLWNPIALILHLFYELTDGAYKSVVTFFSYNRFKEKKKRRVIKKTVSSILNSQSNLLTTFSNNRMAKLFTLLLQSVSFITTYSGLVFFLGTVNPIAPLFVAIVIQGGCYYLLNNVSSKKRKGNTKRILLVVLLIFLSVVTSYIGIFNGTVNPIEKITTQYNSYVHTVNDIIDEQISNSISVDDINISYVKTNYDEIKTINSEANRQIIIKTKEKDNLPKYSYYPTANGGTMSRYNVDSQKRKSQLQAEIDRIDLYNSSLTDFLKSYTFDEIENAYKEIINNGEILFTDNNEKEVYYEFQEAINTYRKLYRELNPNSQKTDEGIIQQLDLSTASIDKETMKILKELELSEYEAVDSKSDKSVSLSEKNFVNNIVINYIHRFIENTNQLVVSEALIEAEETRKILNNTISENYISLRPELSDELARKLDKAKDAATIDNTQIMPFVLPVKEKSTYLKEAIYSFAIALIVDGLSSFFAYVLISKKESSLYFDKVVDMSPNREEILEDCFMYICLDSMVEETVGDDEIEGKILKKLREVMRDFFNNVNLFYFPDTLNAFGYIKAETIKALSDEQKHLFIALQNTTMIQAFSRYEIIKAICVDFDETQDDDTPKCNEKLIEKYKSEFKEDEIYYIVSKSLHVWLCDNFTEIYQNSMPSELKQKKDEE